MARSVGDEAADEEQRLTPVAPHSRRWAVDQRRQDSNVPNICPVVSHRLAEPSIGGDDVGPQAPSERQVEAVVEQVMELECEAQRVRKVLLQRHARDRRSGERCQSFHGFGLRQLSADRAAP